jgi:leucyl/phenylalanyl-tRNA--protein transferase
MFPPSNRPVFPPPQDAGPEGLLMVGGSLRPEWLYEAYRTGIFPMPLRLEGRRVLAWFSPDPRGILEPHEFYTSSRLARRLRRGEFQFSVNQAFPQVIAGCAMPRDNDSDTWLTHSMQTAYIALHELGYAHSVEVWQDGELVGGVYGVAIGGLFAGESMFHRVTDASKAALHYLTRRLIDRGYTLFDVQWTNDHTTSLGAKDIRRRTYLKRLAEAVKLDRSFV